VKHQKNSTLNHIRERNWQQDVLHGFIKLQWMTTADTDKLLFIWNIKTRYIKAVKSF
jgi:hypothetical protein